MKPNFYDSYRGVVHIGQPGMGGEFTVCGLACDEPASEHGAEAMKDTDLPPTCPGCIDTGRRLLDTLRRQLRRVKQENNQ